MFHIVENNQKLVKGILIAVTGAFVVFGIGNYLDFDSNDGYVAKVGGHKIYSQDIDNATDSSQAQPSSKEQTLAGLVSRQVLLSDFENKKLAITKDQLQAAIMAMPEFQESGTGFSVAKYQAFLHKNLMSANKLEGLITQQELIKNTVGFYKDSFFVSSKYTDGLAHYLAAQRNVASYVVSLDAAAQNVKVSDAEIKDFYQKNQASFTTPEQVKLQYIKLSANDIAKSITVSDDDINKYIAEHGSVTNNAQVDASHILLAFPQNATDAQKAQTKAAAEKVLAEVKANPTQFAELATKYSQDPGSAAKGGELGFFGKGMMVKSFEDKAFSMKKGEISNLVETPYGYHIIKVNAIKGNDVASVRSDAKDAIAKKMAMTSLQKTVDQLNDITYSSANSLDPAAKKLNLSVQTSDYVTKGATSGDFANPKLQTAIFSKDVIQDKHNSEVIDLGNGTYIVARALDYKPSGLKKLDDVKVEITKNLQQQKAATQVNADGAAKLAQVQAGKSTLSFSNAKDLPLMGDKDVSADMTKQIFSAPAKFPTYVGGNDAKGNYIIYKINGQSFDKSKEVENQKMVSSFAEQGSNNMLGAYIAELKDKYKVTYNKTAMEQLNQSDTNVAGSQAANASN